MADALNPPAVKVSPLIRVSVEKGLMSIRTGFIAISLQGARWFALGLGVLYGAKHYSELSVIVAIISCRLRSELIVGSLKKKEDEHRAYIEKMKPVWMEQKAQKKKAMERGSCLT